jgi:alpha amylase-like protein
MPASLDASTAVLDRMQTRSSQRVLFPSLYQINTRILLGELSARLKRSATFDDIPDTYLDRLAEQGFDWIWFLGVWQTGEAGRQVSRQQPDWMAEFRDVLPDLRQQDITGSCFAITNYEVNTDFGGNAGLARVRERLQRRGLKLLLDFVPNHTAPDHPWVRTHPEFYVRGSEEQLKREPQNYIRTDKSTVLAYGRDPYFAGWPDTLQLNYAEPALQQAMRQELGKVAERCDGVRCDMAMLILPDVFERTWGMRPEPFWQGAIQSIQASKPDFIFMAEVYWDLEWTLQQQGFNYTYDKRLYDRLREGHARPVRDHLRADPDFQRKSVRFLENHDEPRAAATFSPAVHRAAAIVTFLCPGLRFFHDGEFEGRKKKLPVHLGRRPDEVSDASLQEFYSHLLACVHRPETRDGAWRLLDCAPGWDGNWTWDCFISSSWSRQGGDRLISVVNYAPNQSQCYLQLPFDDIAGDSVKFTDLMGTAVYVRGGDQLRSEGLYLDLPPWGYHVFKVAS